MRPRQPPTCASTSGAAYAASPCPAPFPPSATPFAMPSSESGNHSPSAFGRFAATTVSVTPNKTIAASTLAKLPATARRPSDAAMTSAPSATTRRTPKRSPSPPAGSAPSSAPIERPDQSVPQSRRPRPRSSRIGATITTT